MPIIKSAIKRMRQTTVRTRSNNRVRQTMRSAVKQLKSDISEKNKTAATTGLSTAQASLDKAVKKGVLHKNTAARRKSQLAKSYTSVFGAAKPAKKSAAKTASPATKKTAAKKPVAKPRTKPAAAKAPAKKTTVRKKSAKPKT